MGLDMNILRIKKPHLDAYRIYSRDDLDCIILEEDCLKQPKYQELTPYLQRVRVRSLYVDMERIRKDYGLSEKSYLGHMSADVVGIRDIDRSVEISAKTIEEKYSFNRVEDCYVCNAEEVRYWRKAYDVQDWFYENIESEVENTGYYLLSKDLLEEFNEAWPEDSVLVEDPDEESALYYWEWY